MARNRSLLLGGAWATGAWLLWRMPPPAAHPDPGEPRLSVVVPARDEAGALPRLLGSLAAQTRPPHEVIVVDDHSTDATAALAAHHGARVIPGLALPPGWTGKTWACHQGAAAAEGDLLLFLDADVVLAPDAVERLIGEHRRHGGLVSVQPFHHTERLHERLSAMANVVSLMGSGAFAARSDRSSRVAFGPCVLVGAAEYARLGGHAHPDVRHRVTEDIGLARRAVATATPVHVFAGRQAVSFRMYPDGARQVVDGWTKMLASGARRCPPAAGAGTALWVTGALLASADGLRALRGRGGGRWYALWAAQSAWMLRRTGRFGAATAVAFPLPLAAFVALFLRSAVAVVLRRPVRWRGRPVDRPTATGPGGAAPRAPRSDAQPSRPATASL